MLGRLDCVLRALRVLRPCDPHTNAGGGNARLSEILQEALEKYYWPSLRNTAVALDGHKKLNGLTDDSTKGQGVSMSRMHKCSNFFPLKNRSWAHFVLNGNMHKLG